MPDAGTVELAPNQQQRLSDETQNNNGNDRSLTSTGVGAQEKSTRITDLLEKKVAKMLGVVACGWVLLVLVQGGMVGSLETKDCGFVTLLFFLVFIRCWSHYCPQAYRSFTDATQSLSADSLSIPNDIQQLALPSCYIRRLFYCSSLVSAMTSVVLSVMRLASQDFGKKEVENKESRDFALKVFYGLTLAEALVLLFAEALSFPIRWNSVGLEDGPGDDLEVGLRTRGNSEDGSMNQSNECNGVEQMALPANQSNDFNSEGLADSLPKLRQRRREIPKSGDGEDGSEDGPGGEPGDGPGDGPEDGPGGGPGDDPGDSPEDGPVNQSNECNGVAQMDRPANQSNDFNSEGPVDSLPKLRQRRRELPKWISQVKEGSLDDGHSWRKYGQEDILGAKHPRGYYRCTYRHSQGCQATKQVQQTDDNPTVFDVIYLGTHTCIDPALSATTLTTNSPMGDVDPFLTD